MIHKIMLVVIAISGLISGVLAFDAKRFHSRRFLYTGIDGGGECTVFITGATTTVAGRGTIVAASSIARWNDCPDTFVTTINDTQ